MRNLKKLLEISSQGFLDSHKDIALANLAQTSDLAFELFQTLSLKNGFFAFEGALRFFPSSKVKGNIGLFEWNTPELWIKSYDGLASNYFFFAEDIFGSQFCIKEDKIGYFDPETADFEVIASSFDDWAREILTDFEYWTGHKLASEWQGLNGRIPVDCRLVPKIPFVTGGEYNVGNLSLMNSVAAMNARGCLAKQIKDLPDGSQITFDISKWQL